MTFLNKTSKEIVSVLIILMVLFLTQQTTFAARSVFSRDYYQVQPSSPVRTPSSADSVPTPQPQKPEPEGPAPGVQIPVGRELSTGRSRQPGYVPGFSVEPLLPVQPPPLPPEDNENEKDISNPGAIEILTAEELEALGLLNELRTNNGFPPLVCSAPLVRVARMKAQDLLENNYFGHISPIHGSLGKMLREAGISFNEAGENLSKAGTVYRAHLQLEFSTQGHRQVMLNKDFNQVGIAVLPQGKVPGVIMVQLFTD